MTERVKSNKKENITSDMSEYRKYYRIKNKDKICKNIKCDICAGKYQVCSKNQHFKTKMHKNGLKIKKLENELSELKKSKQA